MLALLNWRVWAAALIAAVLAFTHFAAYRAGQANVRAAWDADKVTQLQNLKVANDENRKLGAKRESAVIQAQSAAVRRDAGLLADVGRAHDQLDGLRDAIRTTGADLPGRAPDAVRSYATDAAGLLASCSKEYAELARDADAIWSERQTLIDAWPQ